jgi:hypothetical protein
MANLLTKNHKIQGACRMRKKLLKTLVLGSLLSLTTTAFAANPFELVPTNNWTYDAIGNLVQGGVFEGYRDINFSKNQTFTRYELATFVGKALANENKANAEQKATIDKLATEFKSELANLGVYATATAPTTTAVVPTTVASTTSPAPAADPVHVSGNFKYEYRSNQDRPNDGTTSYGNRFLYGINLDWKVDDSTAFFGRVAGEINQLGTTTHNGDLNDFKLDEFGVKATKDGWNYSIGRQGVQLGQGGVLYSGVDWASPLTYFDGVVITNKLGKVDLKAVAGRTSAVTLKDTVLSGPPIVPTQKWYGIDLSQDITKDVNAGVVYASRKAAPNPGAALFTNPNEGSNYVSAYTTIKGGNVTWTGEYVRSNADTENNAYDISATYKFDEKNRVTVQYNHVQENATDPANALIGGEYFPNGSAFDHGYKGEYYNYHHTFTKAFSFNADYYALKRMYNATGTDGEFDFNLRWHF